MEDIEILNRHWLGVLGISDETELMKQVEDLKHKLREAYKRLWEEKLRARGTGASEDAFAEFLEAHPSACLDISPDSIDLATFNQSVSFHVRRGGIEGKNGDVVFSALPLYGFNIKFMKSGSVIICQNRIKNASLAVMLDDVFGFKTNNSERMGHPHAVGVSNFRDFSEVCQGNNRFIDEYAAMMRNGVFALSDFLVLLNRAATWLETVNLNDMYGTPLFPSAARLCLDDLDAPDTEMIRRLFVEIQREVKECPWTDIAAAREDDGDRFREFTISVAANLLHTISIYYDNPETEDDIVSTLYSCLLKINNINTDFKTASMLFVITFNFIYELWLYFVSRNGIMSREVCRNAAALDALFTISMKINRFAITNEKSFYGECLRLYKTVFRAPNEYRLAILKGMFGTVNSADDLLEL